MTNPFPFSLLFVPAHDERLRRKAATLGRQTLVLDLEDAVPLAGKDRARSGAVELIDQSPGRCFVRINPLTAATPFSRACGAADLAIVVRQGLRGIVLPKTESAGSVRQAHALICAHEAAAGVPVGTVELLAIVESARGIVALREIAEAAPSRPFRLCFGAGDFATDLRVGWSESEEESRTARSLLVIASRAAGLPSPIDSVYPNLADLDGLARNTRAALALGFKNKFVIHPSQIEVVEAILRPTAEDIEWAERVVAGMRAAEREQRAAFTINGRLVDYPIVARAEEILAAAGLSRGKGHSRPAEGAP